MRNKSIPSPRTGDDRPEDVSAAVRVRVGIDAAITSQHHVSVRQVAADGAVSQTRFRIPPTLAGLEQLTRRLSDCPQAMVVAEPTSMTWLGLAAAVAVGGSGRSVGSRG